jgi:predicted alpha/beta hydrolase family esterase
VARSQRKTKSTRSKYCSGSRRLGGWFRLEGRLRHSCEGWLQRQIVQEPETSFKEDVAATKQTLNLQDGPCILVGHSYGEAVITEAGMDPSVVGLVYIAAHMLGRTLRVSPISLKAR